MDKLTRWIRQRITESALSAAAALMVAKFFLPGIFDFLVDLLVLFLIWIVGFTKDSGDPPK